MKRYRGACLLFTLLLAAALTGCGGKTETVSTAASSSVGTSAAESASEKKSSVPEERSQEESSVPEERSQEESTPDESSEEGLTEEELAQMHEAEERISALCQSEDYQNADEDGRAEMALKLLNELADEGLVIKASINRYYDSISYSFSCGAFGGIMLREWDPETN